MKVLYTSHINGDHFGTTQRLIECDDLIEYVAGEAGLSVSDLMDNAPPEPETQWLHNEHGVFITTPECVESWVIISR